MTVAMVTPVPTTGTPEIGSAYYSRALAQRLAATGIDVEIWAKKTDAEILPSSEFKQLDIMKVWRPGFKSWIDIIGTVRSRRPTIMHIQHAMFVLGNGVAGELSMLALLTSLVLMRQRVVITCHDIPELRQITNEYIALHKYRFPAAFVRLGLRMLFWLIGKCARVVIAHSQNFASTLITDYGVPIRKLAVIPHLAIPYKTTSKSLARATLHLSPQTHYLLFFGFLTGYKGVELLLDAMLVLRDTNPNVHLILGAGEHPKVREAPEYVEYYRAIRDRASSLNNVTSVGFIPDELIDSYIDASDLAVFPYIEFQGSSGPLNQCASHGKNFLVSTFIVEKTKGLGSCGVVCEPVAMAQTIARYFKDSEFAEEVSTTCSGYSDAVRSDDFLKLTAAAYERAS